MSGDRIYLVPDHGDLVPMTQQSYDSEDLLQELIANNPDVLGGATGGLRWLLVQREMAVPDREGGAGRWSLDHLFVDDQGTPTLIEAKRASNTEIRRTVVGQLLDYAANGLEYWPTGALRRALETRLRGDSGDEAAGVAAAVHAVAALTEGADPDDFWSRVEENLRTGRVRLVVLADAIPTELQRVIEFLNERMPDTEVLAIEVQQFVGAGHRTLVPRLIGNTTAASRVKERTKGAEFEELLERADPATREVHARLTDWVTAHDGLTTRSRTSMAYHADEKYLVRLYPVDNTVEFPINRLRERGLDRESEAMWDQLALMCPSKTLSRHHLYLPCRDLVASWERFENDVLPQYLTYLKMPRIDVATGETGGSGGWPETPDARRS